MRRILLSGNCDFDHPRIEQEIRNNFSVEVVRAKSNKEAFDLLKRGKFDLVIVNRIGEFDQEEGLDVIKFMQKDTKLKKIPVMMITNFKDRMQEAVREGAVEGFGKSDLGTGKLVKLLEKYL